MDGRAVGDELKAIAIFLKRILEGLLVDTVS